jgi:hypothetical protein
MRNVFRRALQIIEAIVLTRKKAHRGEKGLVSQSFPMVNPRSLQYARMMLRDAPDLAASVLDASLSLEKAAPTARRRNEIRVSAERSRRRNSVGLNAGGMGAWPGSMDFPGARAGV